MSDDRFHFTITDAARFLGKSPVTLRHWERKGLVVFPRYNGGEGDRRFHLDELRDLAHTAYELKRIGRARLNYVITATTTLEMIEWVNSLENRNRRSTGKREDRTS